MNLRVYIFYYLGYCFYLTLFDVILCSETLVFDRQHVSEIFLTGFDKPSLLLTYSTPRIRGLATYIRLGFSDAMRKKIMFLS